MLSVVETEKEQHFGCWLLTRSNPLCSKFTLIHLHQGGLKVNSLFFAVSKRSCKKLTDIQLFSVFQSPAQTRCS